MTINKDNRFIVNIFGAPIIITSIINSDISFIILIFSIIIFSFYEYFKLIRDKSKFTIFNLLLGFFWISSIAWFIPIYQSISYKFILIIFFAVWITDSLAFIMGKQFGKKKILPFIVLIKHGLVVYLDYCFRCYFYYYYFLIPIFFPLISHYLILL